LTDAKFTCLFLGLVLEESEKTKAAVMVHMYDGEKRAKADLIGPRHVRFGKGVFNI
jgi:hypothetical protein